MLSQGGTASRTATPPATRSMLFLQGEVKHWAHHFLERHKNLPAMNSLMAEPVPTLICYEEDFLFLSQEERFKLRFNLRLHFLINWIAQP